MKYQEYIFKLCADILQQNISIDDNEREIIINLLNQQKISNFTPDESDALINVIMFYEDIADFGLGDELIDYVLELTCTEL